MILIAAMAVGSIHFAHAFKNDDHLWEPGYPTDWRLQFLWHWISTVIPAAFLVHAATLVLGLKDRRSWTALREPGLGAGFVAVVFVSAKAIRCAARGAILVWDYPDGFWTKWMDMVFNRDWPVIYGDLFDKDNEIGIAVAALWAFLFLTGQWRPRPAWDDRLGRALGIFWIAIIPFSWASGIYE
ncbi:hypothetical protein TA3x_002256 [Tundrisphaera sp. TA3]|uniref:hypothetical protein n=1 Tax=Tundrisphaera sp. TA3 TaxID=3435775 RepID=UPI003EBA13F4